MFGMVFFTSLAISARLFSQQVAHLHVAAAVAAATVASNTSKTTTTSAFVSSSNNFPASAPTAASEAIHNNIAHSAAAANTNGESIMIDPEYPGTAVKRMLAARTRVSSLTKDELNDEWEKVRKKILWAGGLKDLQNSRPGQGYTGHSFNDYNHVDLTCMLDKVSHNENDGSVPRIAIGNQLGPGIRIASLPELGDGGSWSTCAIGCNAEPPRDVAHVQFRSRIAFKLVWCPTPSYDTFVLVDDDGKELARGAPKPPLPNLRERQINYKIAAGSKYSKVADEIAAATSTASSARSEL